MLKIGGLVVLSPLVPVARWWGDVLARRLYHPPRRSHHRTPTDRGLDYHAETVRTPDGIDLDIWVIPGRGNDCAVVGHGIGLSKSAGIAQAAILNDLGMTVVMFDHRNHGLSATDPARTGYADRFTLDVKTAVVHARQAAGSNGITVVFGFSFSCFPSIYLLREADHGVDAVMCDSGPTVSIRPLFYGMFDAGLLPTPRGMRSGGPRAAMVEQAIEKGAAMMAAQWPPSVASGSLGRTPLLMITGLNDPIVPPSEVRAFADLYPHAQVAELPGGHLAAIKLNPDAYRDRITSFLAGVRGAKRATGLDDEAHAPS